jgi:uncharacterized membrane protein
MRHLLLALHILFAIFTIGPLVGAASIAARGIRAGDAAAVTASARTVRLYGYLSLLVALLGLGLVQPKWHAKFSYPWVWISLLLYLAALALSLAVLEPTLRRTAGRLTESGAVGGTAGNGTVGSGPAGSEAARAAAAGGVIALLFAVIVFLMVYQPH